MGRYDIPGPKCQHVVFPDRPRTFIEAGNRKTGPHAATVVCYRAKCITDAIEWAYKMTHRKVYVTTKKGK